MGGGGSDTCSAAVVGGVLGGGAPLVVGGSVVLGGIVVVGGAAVVGAVVGGTTLVFGAAVVGAATVVGAGAAVGVPDDAVRRATGPGASIVVEAGAAASTCTGSRAVVPHDAQNATAATPAARSPARRTRGEPGPYAARCRMLLPTIISAPGGPTERTVNGHPLRPAAR